MSVYNYLKLAELLCGVVKEATNLQLIESNSNGPQPSYPFWTYTVTSPYLCITQDVVSGEVFECVISLTGHDLSSLKVLNVAMILNKFMRLSETRFMFQQNNIVLVSLTGVSKRDNFISIEYERTAGFDIRLRIKDDYVEELPQIENIEV